MATRGFREIECYLLELGGFSRRYQAVFGNAAFIEYKMLLGHVNFPDELNRPQTVSQ